MMSIFTLDDVNKRTRIDFKEVKSTSNFETKDGNIHFELKTGDKYTFEFQTDFEDKFSAEVIFYAIR